MLNFNDKLLQLAQQQGLSTDDLNTLEARYIEFTTHMIQQTLRNWHKGGRPVWLAADKNQYLFETQVNLEEFRIALTYGHDVDDKAVDVANDVFYLWDAYRNGVGGTTTEVMDKIRARINESKDAFDQAVKEQRDV